MGKMNRLSLSVADLLERGAMDQPPELRQLFHRLNNQLGIILAHAELLEKKSADARRDGHSQRDSDADGKQSVGRLSRPTNCRPLSSSSKCSLLHAARTKASK
jgi:hypothetical protein